jgi:hypothetical protein
MEMKHETLKIVATCTTLLAIVMVSNRIGNLQGQTKNLPGEGFAPVPGQNGGEDVFGPYDADGTLYTAEVRTGRVQKFTPRPGANPSFLVGKPWGVEQKNQAAR